MVPTCWLSRPGVRCRDCSRSVSPGRSPNPPCRSLGSGLSIDIDGPVYLVVDGHPTRRAKVVKQFVADTDGALRLFVLPAYSPQLNLDEGVWKNVKHDRVGRTAAIDADEFKSKILGALRRLQKMPQTVRAFFAGPDLRYIIA
ncbi:hypothetical protein DMP23_19870 [Amycolatopsis sp. A1MSW2902]